MRVISARIYASLRSVVLLRVFAFEEKFSDMPCMNKVYKDKIGGGLLVSSQGRRAAVVSRKNRLSTADKARVNRGFCFSIGLHRISFFRASEYVGGQTVVFDAPEGKRGGCFLGEPTRRRRPVLPGSAPRPRPAALPCDGPPRPARGMSGFWTRQVTFIFMPLIRCS